MSTLAGFVRNSRSNLLKGPVVLYAKHFSALRLAAKFYDITFRGEEHQSDVYRYMWSNLRHCLPPLERPPRVEPLFIVYLEVLHDMLSPSAPIAAQHGGPGYLDEGVLDSRTKWELYTPAAPSMVFRKCSKPMVITEGLFLEIMRLEHLYRDGEI